VHGLTVADLGDYTAGWPVRLTASVGIGTAGLVNIERESRLSGRTFDKGMLILEGYLRNQYAREQPLALSASLALEQTYGGVDGDSASVAELLCLLSAVAGIPLRQDIAVTGSINQLGEVQAIGAVTEKVEGFFDVCRQLGLTARQGVCIPAANVKHLVPRDDVLAAIDRGEFHVWPIEHVDHGISLLTGLPAGRPQDASTFHGRVQGRLRQMLAALKEFQPTSAVIAPCADAAAGGRPHDPRPPLPGQP
jgi:ATP-dependent Lon protease